MLQGATSVMPKRDAPELTADRRWCCSREVATTATAATTTTAAAAAAATAQGRYVGG